MNIAEIELSHLNHQYLDQKVLLSLGLGPVGDEKDREHALHLALSSPEPIKPPTLDNRTEYFNIQSFQDPIDSQISIFRSPLFGILLLQNVIGYGFNSYQVWTPHMECFTFTKSNFFFWDFFCKDLPFLAKTNNFCFKVRGKVMNCSR